ncbi:cytochrome C oxidase subunit IV family protein [Flavobacterium covae]
MEKHLIKTYTLLLILTLLTSFLQTTDIHHIIKISLTMLLFLIKLVVVAFEFMELKKANIAWKFILISFLFLIIIIVLFINI